MKMKAFFKSVRERKIRYFPRGMTLIELLIVVAISALIMIALLSLYMAGQKYFFNQNSRADTIEESRMPMARISRDIRGAWTVVDSETVDGTSYVTGENCIILKTDPASPYYVVYSYDPINHRLNRVNQGPTGTSTRIIADNLIDDGNGGSPFKLKYFRSDGMTEVTSNYDDAANGAFIVEVELTAQGRAIQRANRPFVETVRTQAKLRNKVLPG